MRLSHSISLLRLAGLLGLLALAITGATATGSMAARSEILLAATAQ